MVYIYAHVKKYIFICPYILRNIIYSYTYIHAHSLAHIHVSKGFTTSAVVCVDAENP